MNGSRFSIRDLKSGSFSVLKALQWRGFQDRRMINLYDTSSSFEIVKVRQSALIAAL